MLGKVSWWDKEARMGIVTDVEGKEWKIQDDMIDDDSMKAKVKEGLVINFEANPSLDNSAMRIDVANPEDQKQFQDDFKALMRAVEDRSHPNLGLRDFCPSLAEDVALVEEAPDLKHIADEAPEELKDFVNELIHHDPDKSVKQTLKNDKALHKIADEMLDDKEDLWDWFSEDESRREYIDAAISNGLITPSILAKGIHEILRAGKYAYNAERLEAAKEWLTQALEAEKEKEEEPEEVEEPEEMEVEEPAEEPEVEDELPDAE
jgi:hypothetical protein